MEVTSSRPGSSSRRRGSFDEPETGTSTRIGWACKRKKLRAGEGMKVELVQCTSVLAVAMVACLMSSTCVLPAEAATNPGDVNVLQQLQQSWGGSTTLWQTSTDPCADRWQGVNCDATNTRVTSLYLISAQLSGTVPAYIKSLTALEILDLSFNAQLSGTLPPELGSLTQLTSLSLQGCSFTGRIPTSLSNLSNLTYLALNNNNLTGPIPSSLGALHKLLWFDVAYNLLSGHLPVSTTSPDGLGLDTLPVIQHYHLSNNSFSGPIPPELGSAKDCVHMLLDFNAFNGSIPASFGNLSNLQILSLHYNQLSGPIPATLNNIIKAGNYSGLHQLRVDHNQLTGTVPNLNALDQLQYVDFSDNPFDAQLYPAWLNLSTSSLLTIVFDNGNLTGPLPPDVLSYPNLQSLSFQNNALNESLTIPSNFASTLQVVALQFNQINDINSRAPANAVLPKLELQGNPVCTGASSLVTASASLCNPVNVSSPTVWNSPLLTSNACGIGCESGLHLNPQNCTCGVPLIVTLEIRTPPFSNIDNTTLWNSLRDETYPQLKLQQSQVWVRDAFFTSAGRVQVEMYFFALTGQYLDRTTQDFIKESFSEQTFQYDSTFKPLIVLSFPIAQVMVMKSGLPKGAIIGIAVAAGVLTVIICLLAFIAFKHKRRADKAELSRPFASWRGGRGDNGEAPKLKGAHWFSFDEIMKITNNFHEDNEIGVGGYGRVYKGTIPGTGEEVAVKRAQQGSMQGAPEFKNEIELLSRVHHRNLVGLVGFCYEHGEQMLVYEYMPNGTLTEWIRGVRSDNPLDWDRRLSIALGAARGLAYLHDHADPPIIHRDVKSCNILLDKRLVAKVADFGLSLLMPEAGDNQVSQVKGTMGYLDPEYYSTQQLSPKSDVYSYGVVLLELLTGRPPLQRGTYIVREVTKAFDENGLPGIWEMLDPVLIDTPVQELEKFVSLALACVAETGAERPTMHAVVKQLETWIGPKAFDAAGIHESLSKKRMSLIPNFLSGDFGRSGGKSPHGDSSSSRNPSGLFQYSGAFAPSPVQAK